MNVCLIGTGYAGLVTGACLAHLGHEVICVDMDARAEGCDAPVVVTEWAEFGRLDLDALRRRTRGGLLVDGRNIFDPDEARAAGFDYAGVGR